MGGGAWVKHGLEQRSKQRECASRRFSPGLTTPSALRDWKARTSRRTLNTRVGKSMISRCPAHSPPPESRAATSRMEEALRLGREVIRLRAQVLGVSVAEAERTMEIEKQQGRNPPRCALPR